MQISITSRFCMAATALRFPHLPLMGQCLQNQLSGFYLVPAGDLERRVADGLPEMPWTGSAQNRLER
ncbi:hypothetical protein, partial [Rhizobium oryzicola]